MKKCREAIRRWAARYVPGMLMAAGLTIALGAIYAAVNLGRAFEELPRSGYDRAEFVLKQTGLESCAYDAANTALGYSDYFRDGDSLYAFEVQRGERERVYEAAMGTAGWKDVQVSAEDYAAWAGQCFFSPAALVRPMDGVVFDAFYFRDNTPEKAESLFHGSRAFSGLPASLGMNGTPYARDFTAAFYDRESGVFIYYDQEM